MWWRPYGHWCPDGHGHPSPGQVWQRQRPGTVSGAIHCRRLRRVPWRTFHKWGHVLAAPTMHTDEGHRGQVSEVGAGSDVAAIKTTAVRDGDEYVINGGKMWTTNGTQADWMCLLANTGEGGIHENKSMMCVPMDAPGVTVAPRFSKLGMRSSDTTQVRSLRRLRAWGLRLVTCGRGTAFACRCGLRTSASRSTTSLGKKARDSSIR